MQQTTLHITLSTSLETGLWFSGRGCDRGIIGS